MGPNGHEYMGIMAQLGQGRKALPSVYKKPVYGAPFSFSSVANPSH